MDCWTEQRDALDKEIRRLFTVLSSVRTRATHASQFAKVYTSEDVRVDTLYHQRQAGVSERVSSRLAMLKQLRLLLTNYYLVVFAVGWQVRSCTWDGQGVSSARHAKEALQWTLSLLYRLYLEDPNRLKYI